MLQHFMHLLCFYSHHISIDAYLNLNTYSTESPTFQWMWFAHFRLNNFNILVYSKCIEKMPMTFSEYWFWDFFFIISFPDFYLAGPKRGNNAKTISFDDHIHSFWINNHCNITNHQSCGVQMKNEFQEWQIQLHFVVNLIQ